MKVVKKKVVKKNVRDKLYLTLVLSVAFFLVTQTFVRTENIRLMRETQDMEREISVLSQENEVLVQSIQGLSSYSRVTEVARQGGLESRNNIRFVSKGN